MLMYWFEIGSECSDSTVHAMLLHVTASRVVTEQYLNGLFDSFGNFGPSKQTPFLSSIKQTKVAVCSVA